MPSSTSKTTSEGTPRIVEVIGATVTFDRYPIALLRVRTTTGRFLSGGANSYSRTSPRAIRLGAIRAAIPPLLPNRVLHRLQVVAWNNRDGPVLPWPEALDFAGVRARHREPAQTGSFSSAGRLGQQRAGASCRGQFVRFPPTQYIPQYSPQSTGATCPRIARSRWERFR